MYSYFTHKNNNVQIGNYYYSMIILNLFANLSLFEVNDAPILDDVSS